jgi:hypothetical protein
MSDEKILPTYENVLPEMRRFVVEQSNTKLLGLMGGLPCPWCHTEMFNTSQDHYLAICSKDPAHQVIWLPWGG